MTKRAAEGIADGVINQAFGGLVEVTGQLPTGAAQAVSGIVEAASIERTMVEEPRLSTARA